MKQSVEVIKTAFVLIYLKAIDYNMLGEEFTDRNAKKFIVEEAKNAGNYMIKIFPPIVPWIKMRDRYFDSAIKNAQENNFSQIIILGAGLDLRPLRFKESNLTFFEVDYPSTIDFKKEKFIEFNIEGNSKFIKGNYLEIELINELVQNGCNLKASTLILWEGNSMYQTEENVQKLMNVLKNNFENFNLHFDFLPKAIINKTSGDISLDEGLDAWFKVGAPFIYSVESIERFAEKFDFEPIEQVSCNQMMEKIIGRKLPEYDVAYYNLYFFGGVHHKKQLEK